MELSLVTKSLAKRDSFAIVDAQHRDRDPTDCRQGYHFDIDPGKVFGPGVGSRIEQTGQCARIWIDAGNVRSLKTIAVNAR